MGGSTRVARTLIFSIITRPMNTTIFYFFYNLAHQSDFLDQIIVFFAVYFPYVVGLSALAFLFFYRKSYKETAFVFGTGFFAFGISEIFKILFHAIRPFLTLQNVQSLFIENGYAFPSGHATFFSALALTIFFINKKASYWFIFFALLIGLARIVAGVHFPIDILGGFVLGTAIACLVNFLAFSRKNV